MGEANDLKSIVAFQELQERFLIPWEMLERYALENDSDPDRTRNFLREEVSKRDQVNFGPDGFIDYVTLRSDSWIWEGSQSCGHSDSGPCQCRGPIRAVCLNCMARFSLRRKLKGTPCLSCSQGKLVGWEVLSLQQREKFIEDLSGSPDLKLWLAEAAKKKRRHRKLFLGLISSITLFALTTWSAFSFGFQAQFIITSFLFPTFLFVWGILSAKRKIRGDKSIERSGEVFIKLVLKLSLRKSSIVFSLFAALGVSFLIVELVSGLFTAFDSFANSEDALWYLFFALLIVGYIGYLFDANGAAKYETDVIMRADEANRLFIKKNQESGASNKESRLREIDELLRSGQISSEEHKSARKKIIES